MKFLISAGVVVFRMHNNVREYLLLHYLSGHWDFAKGKMEEGETKPETALRELQEEANISAKLFDGFQEQLSYMFKYKGELTKKTVYFFVGEAVGDDIKMSREHKGYLWLPYQEAHARLTFKNAKEVLEKAEQFIVHA